MLRRLPQGLRSPRKKLTEAVRLWARGDLVAATDTEGADIYEQEQRDNLSDLERMAQAMGLVMQDADQLAERNRPQTYYLWPDNADAFSLFLAVQTQWRTGFAGRTGLDYSGVQVVMRMHGVPAASRAETFVMLQACERAALDEWALKHGS